MRNKHYTASVHIEWQNENQIGAYDIRLFHQNLIGITGFDQINFIQNISQKVAKTCDILNNPERLITKDLDKIKIEI